MTKWDYRVLTVRDKRESEIQAILQRMGQDGWELVSTMNSDAMILYLVLKRPL